MGNWDKNRERVMAGAKPLQPKPRKRAELTGVDLMSRCFPKTRSRAEARSQKRPFYRPLPTQFQRDGFNYRQIAREGDAAIYSQSRTDYSNPSVSYEVIHIRHRDGFHIDGRFVEPAEVYPNSEAWGADGFTLRDREAAFAKLKEVCR